MIQKNNNSIIRTRLGTMEGTTTLYIISWNVRGLSDPHKKVILKNWIGGLQKRIDILMIQELKAINFRLEAALAYILP
jgi:hypothetical protein